DVRVADLPEAADRLLPFQPVDRGLNGRVRRTRFRERLRKLANRRLASGPDGFQDLQFESRQSRAAHRQFSLGRSTRSIVSISTGASPASNRSPSGSGNTREAKRAGVIPRGRGSPGGGGGSGISAMKSKSASK